MQCWKCFFPIAEKIRFRTECSKCGSYLHVCKNCQNYFPGKPNDCSVPDTEPVRDREIANYCEDFKPLIKKEEKQQDTRKNRFDSLFND